MAEVQQFRIAETLDQEWLKLAVAVMQDCGPAAQTLAGLWKITQKETFVPLGKISLAARVPEGTVRKHLVTLHDHGWIVMKGRQETRKGRTRKTSTITLTTKAKHAMGVYTVLPWWACCSIGQCGKIKRVGRLSWSTRAVLSVVMARLMALKAAALSQEEPVDTWEDILGACDKMGGRDRFRFSLRALESQTGLTRDSIVTAKRSLHRLTICQWFGGPVENGRADTHLLVPSFRFRIVVTTAGEHKCYVHFKPHA